jgi:hypothetical protein|tara:strand:+ start:165 stop:347 length:183 start_codon:yes stop_codon:yes gene_type:complete
MIIWVAAAAIGIVIALVLVFKYTKTGKNDVLGFSMKCRTCGATTNGLKCSRCQPNKKDWR